MDNIKVSVILPSLNTAKYIQKCLASVADQTLKEIEIICVDGGSTDGTIEIISSFAAKDSRIKVIRSDKKSYGYQVNIGMDAAVGKYIGIVETDDYILPNMYENLYRIAENEKVDIVKSDWAQFYDEEESASQDIVVMHLNPGVYNRIINPLYENICFYLPLSTWNGIYRRDFLEKHNIRHNESPGASYQDNGFFFQTIAYAEKIYVVHDFFYKLRRNDHGNSIVNTANMHRILGEFRFIRELLKKDSYLYEHFRYEFGYLFVQNSQWLFERMLYKDREAFLREFVDELKEVIAYDCIDYAYFEDRHLIFLFSVLNNLSQYIEREIGDFALLQQAIKGKKDIFVYGTKNCGRDLFNEIRNRFPFNKIAGFVVSKREDGKMMFCGQRLYELAELREADKNSLFIIAVRTEKVRKEIVENLKTEGFCNILYAYWQRFWHMYDLRNQMILKKYEV